MAAGACLAGITACRDAPAAPTTSGPAFERLGVAERGGIVTYRLRGPDGEPATIVPDAIRVNPSDAALVWAGSDSLRLVRTGRVVVQLESARSVWADTLVVGEPPWIVFDADTAGNRDIWLMRIDGSERRRLTTEPSDDRDPTAAGGHVVFVSGRSGALDLWRVPVGGGTASPLTTTAESDGAPAMSRAGDRLAWLVGNGPSLVRVGAGDASAASRFGPATTSSLNNDEFSPAISPAGDRIAFATIRTGRLQVLVGAVGGAAGSAIPATVDDSALLSEPAFSPDGRRLAVTRTVQRSGMPEANDLAVITLATGARVTLTTIGTATHPVWLEDGRLLFRTGTAGAARLAWLDPSRPTRLVPVPSGGLAPRTVDAVR